MCLYVLYKTCAGVNIDPMGQTFKKNFLISYKIIHITIYFSLQEKFLLGPLVVNFEVAKNGFKVNLELLGLATLL